MTGGPGGSAEVAAKDKSATGKGAAKGKGKIVMPKGQASLAVFFAKSDSSGDAKNTAEGHRRLSEAAPSNSAGEGSGGIMSPAAARVTPGGERRTVPPSSSEKKPEAEKETDQSSPPGPADIPTVTEKQDTAEEQNIMTTPAPKKADSEGDGTKASSSSKAPTCSGRSSRGKPMGKKKGATSTASSSTSQSSSSSSSPSADKENAGAAVANATLNATAAAAEAADGQGKKDMEEMGHEQQQEGEGDEAKKKDGEEEAKATGTAVPTKADDDKDEANVVVVIEDEDGGGQEPGKEDEKLSSVATIATPAGVAPAGGAGGGASSTAGKAPAKKPAARRSSGSGKSKASAAAAKAAAPAQPPSPLELKNREKLEAFLLTCRHEGEEEPDYRLGVDEALEAARACQVEAAEGETSMTAAVPDDLVPLLARLVQGRPCPLSELTRDIVQFLTEQLVPCVEKLTEEGLKERIRHIAERKPYGNKPKSAIVMEDTCPEAIWRWDVVQPDVLPTSKAAVNAVKEARAERANAGKYVKALSALIKTIQRNPNDESAISQAEEKVVALERQAEVVRQRKALMLKKEEDKAKAAAEKAEKARLREEEKVKKREEKEQKEKEKQEKRKRDEAADEASEEGAGGGQGKKKAAVVDVKQPAISRFFKVMEPTPSKAGESGAAGLSSDPVAASTVPSSATAAKQAARGEEAAGAAAEEKVKAMDAAMRAGMSRDDLLKDLMQRGKAAASSARNPKYKPHRYVTVDVTVTRRSEGMWNQPDFAELEEKRLWNAMKFLKFAEDVRPPYFGTWSRRSREVKPRHFWGKAKFVDYDYDSEEDWEDGDGDDGDGESLSVTAQDDKEEDPQDGLDYTDGWLARDDEMDREDGEEGDDDQVSGGGTTNEDKAQVRLGVYFFDADFEADKPVVDDRLRPTLAPFRVVPTDPAVASFPIQFPLLDGEGEEKDEDAGAMAVDNSACVATAEDGKSGGKKEGDAATGRAPKSLDVQLMPTFFELLEGNRQGKDKIVEAFLTSHPGAASKAHIRTLIEKNAEKQKDPSGKSLWVVKQEVLDQYSVARFQPPPPPPPKATKKGDGNDAGKIPKKRKATPKKTKKDTAVGDVSTPTTLNSTQLSTATSSTTVSAANNVEPQPPLAKKARSSVEGKANDLKGVPVLTNFWKKKNDTETKDENENKAGAAESGCVDDPASVHGKEKTGAAGTPDKSEKGAPVELESAQQHGKEVDSNN